MKIFNLLTIIMWLIVLTIHLSAQLDISYAVFVLVVITIIVSQLEVMILKD